MDSQQNLRNMRERDAMFHTEMPYPIETMNIGDYAKYREKFAKSRAYILMDLPGTLNDMRLKPIIEHLAYPFSP